MSMMSKIIPKTKKEDEVKIFIEPDQKRIKLENIKYADYQRELKHSKVKQIVENFIPEIATPPLISFRRGEFWCVDGQHTIKALIEMGYKEITCRILTGLTYEEECLRFVIINTGRTRLTANQIFHGRVEEKDIRAIALVKLFNKYGFAYNKNCSGRGENLIGTVNSFVLMQRNYGMDMVERVLRVLRKAWLGEADSLLASIINGLKTFLNEYPECDEAFLIKALEKITPGDLEHDAEEFKKGKKIRPARAGSTCYHVAKIIEQLYNDEISMPRRGRRKIEAV